MAQARGLVVLDLAFVHVPSHPVFASLDIAGALTILAYESWIARHGDCLATSEDGTVVADLDIAAAPPPRGRKRPPSPP